MIKQTKKPVLMIIAVIICLCMVRLGFWQLDRADQKRDILSQSVHLSEMPAVDVTSLVSDFELNSADLRFRQVYAQGVYLPDQSIFIDNQVLNTKVGYSLITPFQLTASEQVIMVVRGWLSVGLSRQKLPEFVTPLGTQTLRGRLNMPAAKPPLWNDDFDVADGQVWQFLPIDDFRLQTSLSSLPLVLELAPVDNLDSSDNNGQAPIVNWQTIDDEWVYKHQAYALQWFSMAVVFFIACLILLIKSVRKSGHNGSKPDSDI